jgi:hypothetical protein
VQRSELIEAAEIIAEGIDLDEDELIQRLVDRGFETSVAHRLVAFMPSALARPVLEELGVTNFAECMAISLSGGGDVYVRLQDQPEYVAVLALAREHRRHGILKPETYRAIVGETAEIDAISNALNAGANVAGSSVTTALLPPIYADHVIAPRRNWIHRFGNWLRRLPSRR